MLVFVLAALAAGRGKIVRDEAGQAGQAALEVAVSGVDEVFEFSGDDDVGSPQQQALVETVAEAAVRVSRSEASAEAQVEQGLVAELSVGMQLGQYLLLESLSACDGGAQHAGAFQLRPQQVPKAVGSIYGAFTGSRLANANYECDNYLGKGAYGVVYKARKLFHDADDELIGPGMDCSRQDSNCIVAIKVLKGTSDSAKEDWEAEDVACGVLHRLHAKARAAHADSSMIMKCIAAHVSTPDRDGRTGYLVYEFLQGRDMEKHSTSTQGHSQLRSDRITILQKLMQGIYLMSELRVPGYPMVVHRDLKPANVMIDFGAGEPVVKIIDFGLAEEFHPENETLGTPQPECWQCAEHKCSPPTAPRHLRCTGCALGRTKDPTSGLCVKQRQHDSPYFEFNYVWAPPEVNIMPYDSARGLFYRPHLGRSPNNYVDHAIEFGLCSSNGVTSFDVYSAGMLSYATASPNFHWDDVRRGWTGMYTGRRNTISSQWQDAPRPEDRDPENHLVDWNERHDMDMELQHSIMDLDACKRPLPSEVLRRLRMLETCNTDATVKAQMKASLTAPLKACDAEKVQAADGCVAKRLCEKPSSRYRGEASADCAHRLATHPDLLERELQAECPASGHVPQPDCIRRLKRSWCPAETSAAAQSYNTCLERVVKKCLAGESEGTYYHLDARTNAKSKVRRLSSNSKIPSGISACRNVVLTRCMTDDLFRRLTTAYA